MFPRPTTLFEYPLILNFDHKKKNIRIGAEELKFLADMLQERRKEVDILRENARLGVSNRERSFYGVWLLLNKKNGPHVLNVWYIYLHLVDFYGTCR